MAEVERVVTAFAEAWNRHHMEEFAELFAPDAEPDVAAVTIGAVADPKFRWPHVILANHGISFHNCIDD